MRRTIGQWLLVASVLAGCAGLALTPDPRTVHTASSVSVIVTPTARIRPALSGAVPTEQTQARFITPTEETGSVFISPLLPEKIAVTVTPTPLEPSDTVQPPGPTDTPEPIAPTATDTPTPTPSGPTVTPAPVRPAFAPTAIALRALTAVDTRFRPVANGYQFYNYADVQPTDFTITDTRKMFGDAEVCVTGSSPCLPRQAYVAFTDYVNETIRVGHCDGITLTTLRFFLSLDRPTALKANVFSAFNLPRELARRSIAYYWSLQVPDPVARIKYDSMQRTPVEILQMLMTAMTSRSRDLTSIHVFNADLTAGHSMTPYRIDSAGNGVWRVWVYDSNHPYNPRSPADSNRYISISTRTNTWSYDLGYTFGTWSGNATSHNLAIVPVSAYSLPPVCFLCWQTGASTSGLLVSPDANTQLLVTDAAGRRLGTLNGTVYEEIPGAFRDVLPGGLGQRDAPVFHLPITSTYAFLLSLPVTGTLLPTTTAPSSITEFGPGFVTSVSDINLKDTQSSRLAVRADGHQLVYQSPITDRDTFRMIVETADQSRQLIVRGATIGAGRTMTLTIDDGRGRFIIDNSQNISGTYDLTFTRITAIEVQTFTTFNVPLGTGDTQSIDFGAWSGTGPMTMTINLSSQGTLTQTLPLPNLQFKNYIPVFVN